MKHFLYLFCLLFFSCGNPCDDRDTAEIQLGYLKQDIAEKTRELNAVIKEVDQYSFQLNKYQREMEQTHQKLLAQGIIKEGGYPVYLVSFEIKQVHYNLNFKDALKDKMNSFTLSIPVSEKFYYSLSVGQVIESNFRHGSMILTGSLGSQKVTVIEKRITKF